MKRGLDDVEKDDYGFNKIKHHGKSMSKSTNIILDLPLDILRRVFDLLHPLDICNCASLNHRYRRLLKHLAFHRAKTTWFRLIRQENFATEIIQAVNKLRIVDSYSYGEWQIDLFKLLENFTNLNQLSINSCNSSNWLKYRKSNQIKSLNLFYEKGHSESEEFETQLLNPHPQQSKTRTTHEIRKPPLKHIVSTSPKIFSIIHLNQFTVLSQLSLNAYHFNWGIEEKSNLRLDHLKLVDCTWEYPFTLSQFNHNNSIKKLELIYHSHPFVLSERFGKFLENPMQHANDSIYEFSIYLLEFNDSTWRKVLSIKQLENFAFPYLKKLTLIGFTINLNYYKSYTEILEKMIHLKKIKIGVWDTSGNHLNKAYFKKIANEINVKCIIEDMKYPFLGR